MKKILSLLALLFISSALMAGNANPDEFEPVPEPPELPDPLESGENIEPQVTIIRKDDAIVEEYRVNGYLYMVKVKPFIGPSYTLIDKNGDGTMVKTTEIEEVVVPQWVLFTW